MFNQENTTLCVSKCFNEVESTTEDMKSLGVQSLIRNQLIK